MDTVKQDKLRPRDKKQIREKREKQIREKLENEAYRTRVVDIPPDDQKPWREELKLKGMWFLNVDGGKGVVSVIGDRVRVRLPKMNKGELSYDQAGMLIELLKKAINYLHDQEVGKE